MSAEASAPVDFALLGHPASYDHLGDLLQQTKKDFNAEKLRRHEPLLRKFFDWTPSYPTHHELTATDTRGISVTGRVIICTFMPDRLQTPRDMLAAYQKTVAGCRVAQSLGARVVGLGGFTSIVSGDQGRRLAAEIGVAVTSGNSLTAALALDQIEGVLGQLGWRLPDRTLAVIGAGGDIGRACTFRLAPRARRVLLIGRNLAPLERLRAELPAGLAVSLSTRVSDATACDIIVAATSAAGPLLDEADLPAGTVAFDVAYPRNVRAAPAPRADTLLVPVGRARLPFALPLTDYTRLGDPRLLFGCFTEAIVLALTGNFESYSVGQGCITEERMERILALAHQCGVVGADPFGDAGVTMDERLDQFLGTFGDVSRLEERDAIVAEIRAMVATRLKIAPDEVPIDRNLMIDLGLESLDVIGVLVELEERFGPLPADAAGAELQTLDDLATYFARRQPPL